MKEMIFILTILVISIIYWGLATIKAMIDAWSEEYKNL